VLPADYDGLVERFDVIVVGAGPAGSTAAYRLATAGASVLLVDKARFPRDKPCGGGLTLRAVRQLPVSPEPVVEHEVSRFELRLRYGRRFERGSDRPVVLMTQRRRLDAYLAQQAALAGAEFRPGAKVTGLTAEPDRVSARVDGGAVEAAALVGADGANGITARSLGLAGDIEHGVALEGNVPNGPARAERYRGKAFVELGTVPGGYGWVFPKGDHVNVGVGGWQSEGPTLREHLQRLCAAHGIGEEDVAELRGHRLPMRRAGTVLARGRVLLVGDAAGLVDPLSGDGMYEAFLSSRLATDAILELLAGRAEHLEAYGRALTAALALNASASWGAKIALERFPRTTFAIARLPLVWRMVESLLRGEVSHPGAARGIVRAPLRLIDGLARTAGDPGGAFRVEARTAR
jgi:geranylgeranyl reductase family protein